MTTKRRSAVTASRLLHLGCIALLAACDGDPSGGGDGGTDGDTDADTDSDTEDPHEQNDFVESYAPLSPPPVRLNRMIAVVFAPGSQLGDHILPESVHAEIDGAQERLFPYLRDNDANREFRFVPFLLWKPDSAVTVRIFEGVTYAGTGESMEGDLAWTFQVEDAPFDEVWDESTCLDLSGEELQLAAAGGATFTPANIVGNWQDPDSSLYLVSEPADPDDPEVLHLAAKLRDSLTAVGGIGLAAPQVGINRRVFGAQLPGRVAEGYINPVIVDWSKDESYYWQNGLVGEGCLSIGGVSARVARPRWIVVDYHTADGTWVSGDYLENNTATTFLHEYDHLNGILITDRQERK